MAPLVVLRHARDNAEAVGAVFRGGIKHMGLRDWFRRKPDEEEPKEPAPSLPWEQHPSIYEHLRSRLSSVKSGSVEDAGDLPDEERINAGSQIRWAAGARDGVAVYHMGSGGSGDDANRLLGLVREYGNAPSVSNKLKVYEFVVEKGALGIIDPFTEALVQSTDVNHRRLYDLARSFATEASDREPAKLGIALLGLFRRPEDREILFLLGAHDEFTLFSAVAIANREGDAAHDLWRLAKSAQGWGRVHAVHRLAKTEDPRIKDWLLREGYKNAVMYEYSAYTCAVAGGLLAALQAEDIDVELLQSAGEIIRALLAGGPAENIDNYEEGAAVVEYYLERLAVKASTLSDFLTVVAIRRFLEDEEADWDGRTSCGWTGERRGRLADTCSSIMQQPRWHEAVLAGLESTDERLFHQANEAAAELGIDSWQYHWKRLQASPLDQGRWFHVMHACNNDRIEDVLAFARQAIPLDRVATGPTKEMGLGKGYELHRCVGFILQDLTRFPGHGGDIVRAGLRSPVVSNRNGALRVLDAWGKASWPEGTDAILTEALSQEPDEQVRQSIQKVIDGAPLDEEKQRSL